MHRRFLLFLHILVSLCLLLIPSMSSAETAKNVTPLFSVTKSPPVMDRVNRVIYSNVTVTNKTNEVIEGIFRAVIVNSSIPLSALPVPPDGMTESDEPYYLLSRGKTTELAPGGMQIFRVNFLSQRALLSYEIRLEDLMSNIQSVGPEGGQLHFPGDIVFDVPPGAVAENVDIELGPVDCVDVDTIMGISWSSNSRKCLAGFQAGPDGLTFAHPVVVTLPIPPISYQTVPVPAFFDESLGIYRMLASTLNYSPDSGVVVFELNHFSEVVILELYFVPEGAGELDCEADPEMCLELFDFCNDCMNEYHPDCDKLDILQPSCCLVDPEDREACGFITCDGIRESCNCNCCRENVIDVTTTEGVVVTGSEQGACTIVGSDVTVGFLSCPGQPVETESISEVTPGCTFQVEPALMQLHQCEKGLLQANLIGQNGVVNINEYVEWTTVPTFSDSITVEGGTVTGGRELTNIPVIVRASVGGSYAASEVSHITVVDLGLSINPPESNEITAGQAIQLTATCSECPNPIGWRSSPENIVELSTSGNGTVTVKGLTGGEVEIIAYTNNFCGDEETATINLSVTIPGASLQISAEPNAITIGDSATITAVAKDFEGNIIDNVQGINWSTTTGLEIDSTSSNSATVTGVLPAGRATVTATLNELSASADINVSVLGGQWLMIYSSPKILSCSPEPEFEIPTSGVVIRYQTIVENGSEISFPTSRGGRVGTFFPPSIEYHNTLPYVSGAGIVTSITTTGTVDPTYKSFNAHSEITWRMTEYPIVCKMSQEIGATKVSAAP